MAIRERIRTGLGQIAIPEGIAVQKDAKGNAVFTEGMVTKLVSVVQTLARKMNGLISLGDGLPASWAGNIDAQYVTVVFPAVANTEVEIPHGLNRVLVGYLAIRKDRACDVYDSNAGSWTTARVLLKCSVASSTVKLLLW